MPLMLNFTSPEDIEIVEAKEIAVIYDPVLQITYSMGGGSSKKTKSQKGKKQTIKEHSSKSGFKYKDDYDYGSDD